MTGAVPATSGITSTTGTKFSSEFSGLLGERGDMNLPLLEESGRPAHGRLGLEMGWLRD
eukprot:CAMPEP_0173389466 /NCGR_PEP_ID=MMETSP1356-20130122/12002_1 /TAXON_ID=77927 ORGANISM="Hemiselmis virescens, Strain PCC157" /NCGR_SAMPLE_ID=MMETSP1356 /ASSEMBLY_ACC=CAM_ASM_000847 /LENGTH=58 /DNA_ID=CAMNT_0014346635 /DNA_START=17 /DNA_END=196 /DNA_ORIENTATION=+